MRTDLALAVDIGGTRLRSALVRMDGTILHREVRETPAQRGADAVVATVKEACEAVLTETGAPRSLPLGLCAPGPLDPRAGVALGTPTIEGFKDFPLRQAVSDALGLEVTIDNDGPAAALGEWKFGAGRGCSDFVFITVSTGIGGGIVADGKLFRGSAGLAGHIGHLPVKPDGEMCFCGQRGHWEAEASGTALQRRARASGFGSLQQAFELGRSSDERGIAFSEEVADELAVGIVAIVHLLNPERIVIGGGVSNAFDVFAGPLRRKLSSLLLPPFRGLEILHAEQGDDAGLLGAAALALDPALRFKTAAAA